MINYQTITIDLQPDYREPVVQMYLSERDVGRPIQVNVLMQGQPYSFTAGTTVHIDLRKPSGHVVQVNGNYAVGSNVVLFNVVEQMAAEPGMCLTELSIVGDGQDPIGSKNWLTKVEISPMHAGDPSETWIEDLDELVQDAMEGHIDATLSIPGDAADAAAVGEEIADLQSAFNGMLAKHIDKSAWSLGSFWASSGANRATTTDMRTEFLPDTTLYIFPESSYHVSFYCWDKQTSEYQGIWTGSSFNKSTITWFTGVYDLSPIKSYKVRAVAAKVDGTTISLATDALKILFYDQTDTTLSIPGAIADAKITGDVTAGISAGIIPIELELGTISTNGNKSTATNRARTVKAIHFDKDTYIQCLDSNYAFGVYNFTSEIISSANYINFSGTFYGTFLCVANHYYGLTIAKRDDSAISDITAVDGKLASWTPMYYETMQQYTLQRFAPYGNTRRKIYAHKGITANAPENTIPSFEAAGTGGAWAIETDVQATSDGYLICMHDATVDRTTDGTGTVSEMTMAEIDDLRIKDHPDLKVPTVEQYLEICKTYGCVPCVEIKNSASSQAMVTKLIQAMADYGLESTAVLISTVYSIGYVQSINPKIRCIFIIDPTDLDNEIAVAQRYFNVSVTMASGTYTITHEIIKKLHDAGLAANVGGVNTVEDIKAYFAMGADSVSSDLIATY